MSERVIHLCNRMLKYCRVCPGNVTADKGSGFDNSIYWIISQAITAINYNTLKVNTSTIELP
jgi:hypothetical protein